MNSKTKNIILVVGFIILLMVSYRFAISKTLKLKSEYKSLILEEKVLQEMPKQLELLHQKQRYYDSILNRFELSGSSLQNNLLKTINSYAKEHQLKVVSFFEPHLLSQDDFTIKTYGFTLEGNFEAIQNLVYILEQHTKFGEIVNLHFEKKKNLKTGKFYLQAKILLRSFG